MAVHPLADVSPVETAGQLRRQRRALTEDELTTQLPEIGRAHV